MNLQYSQGRDTDLTSGIIKMNNEGIVVDSDRDKMNLKSITLIEY
jgi:hypothetical protein